VGESESDGDGDCESGDLLACFFFCGPCVTQPWMILKDPLPATADLGMKNGFDLKMLFSILLLW
jgi:hypothetical protein